MSTKATLSPYAKVRPVRLPDVRWTQGFWAERFAVCREVIVPDLWELMEGTTRTHYLQNFRIAAGLAEGRHRGAPFNDGDFYKCLEAICAVVQFEKENGLSSPWAARLDESIEIIARAQREDGYLHTKVQIPALNGTPGPQPFEVPTDFEMYNMGHLFTAACLHHRVTGQTNFLAVATRCADFLCEAFAEPHPQMLRCAVCPSHYMGLVELYRTTGETRYLDLARNLIEWRHMVPDGGDDNQDRIAFKAQRIAAGHAVRANYLFAGAADVFLENGDEALWHSLKALWTDVVEHKLYLTGGCGALYDGASPDASEAQETITRVHQSYGRAYQLPNQTAHNETCAAIGSVLWNWRMFLATGEARYVDVLESTLLNGVLCGATLDGTLYSYTNPLRFLKTQPVPLRYGGGARAPFVSSFCCPPNLARTVAQSHAYAYAQSEGAVWVNLYGSSVLHTELGGDVLELAQETNYPWDGNVQIRINQCPATVFALHLRIPNWAKNASVCINGEPFGAEVTPGTYLPISREWKAGDRLELDLPMEPVWIESHPLIEETRHQVALTRGPLVYCLESPDLPHDVTVGEVRLRPDTPLELRFDAPWPGFGVLEGEAVRDAEAQWSGQLYREFKAPGTATMRVRLIPYFAWNNRGESEMSVWMPFTFGMR